MTPTDIDRPLLYIVTWFDEHNRQHTQQVADQKAGVDLTIEKRMQGYTAGWDRLDPLSGGDTNAGV